MSECRSYVVFSSLDSKWQTKNIGCGILRIFEGVNNLLLIIESDFDGSVVCHRQILIGALYELHDCMIVINEGREIADLDFVLSFEDNVARDNVWEYICFILKKDSSVRMVRYITLPVCEIRNLKLISSTISNCMHTFSSKKELLGLLRGHKFIEKLFILFQICENVNNLESLYELNVIFKNIIAIDDEDVLKLLFNESHILDVIGILEYERGNLAPNNYREQLKDAKFHNPMKIRDADLLNKIHQIFRIQYIQEILSPISPVLSEVKTKPLQDFLKKNKLEVVEYIRQDKNLLRKLNHIVRLEKTTKEKKIEIMGFLKELVEFAKCVEFGFYDTLMDIRVFSIIKSCMISNDFEVALKAIELLSFMVHCSKDIVKFYMLEHSSFCLLIFNPNIAENDGFYISDELIDILKNLLYHDRCPLHQRFLAHFYKKCGIQNFLIPLFRMHVCEDDIDFKKAKSLERVMNLLIFCVDHHEDYIKNLRGSIFIRPLAYIRSSHKFLVIVSIRLLKSLVYLRDEFFHEFIIEHGLMDPVFDVLIKNKAKENSIQSTILELFEFIVLMKFKVLCWYYIDKVEALLDTCDYKVLRLLLPYYGQLKSSKDWDNDFDDIL